MNGQGVSDLQHFFALIFRLIFRRSQRVSPAGFIEDSELHRSTRSSFRDFAISRFPFSSVCAIFNSHRMMLEFSSWK